MCYYRFDNLTWWAKPNGEAIACGAIHRGSDSPRSPMTIHLHNSVYSALTPYCGFRGQSMITTGMDKEKYGNMPDHCERCLLIFTKHVNGTKDAHIVANSLTTNLENKYGSPFEKMSLKEKFEQVEKDIETVHDLLLSKDYPSDDYYLLVAAGSRLERLKNEVIYGKK